MSKTGQCLITTGDGAAPNKDNALACDAIQDTPNKRLILSRRDRSDTSNRRSDIIAEMRLPGHNLMKKAAPMIRLVIRWVLNALALMLIALVLPGMHVTFVAALIAAIVIGAINALLRPIIVLLTLPVTLLTLGLFLLVINALLFWL